MRDPEVILERAGKVLDFDQPIALSMLALLHFVGDEDGAYDLVRKLVDELAPGSYLVLSHVTGDFDPEGAAKAVAMYKARGLTLRPRSRDELAAFFEGLELVEPGVTLTASGTRSWVRSSRSRATTRSRAGPPSAASSDGTRCARRGPRTLPVRGPSCAIRRAVRPRLDQRRQEGLRRDPRCRPRRSCGTRSCGVP